MGRQLKETYADTGLVRFEYNHFAFLGPESNGAAEASECANEQGKFWQYHDTIFLNHFGENMGAYSDNNLKRFAAALGLDEGEFNSCLDSNRYRGQVLADLEAGREIGVTSTPSIVVNGQLLSGAVPFDRLQAIIQAELAR